MLTCLLPAAVIETVGLNTVCLHCSLLVENIKRRVYVKFKLSFDSSLLVTYIGPVLTLMFQYRPILWVPYLDAKLTAVSETIVHVCSRIL